MTIISDANPQVGSRSSFFRVCLVLTCVIGVALTAFLLAAGNRKPDPEVVQRKSVAVAQLMFEEERYREVVDTLKTHLPELAENRNVTGLRLFADSCLKVPLPGNRHLGAASEVYRRILGISNHDVYAARRLTEIYASAGKPDEAIRYAKVSLELQPDNCDWRLDLAELHIRVGDFDSAIAVADGILLATPTDRNALDVRIRAMVASLDSSERILSFISEYIQNVGMPQLGPELQLMHAQATGNDSAAAILLDRTSGAVLEDKSHADWLATAVNRQGDVRRAADLLAETDFSTQDLKPVLYRYMQQNDFASVEELLTESDVNEDSELLVIRILARVQSGQADVGSLIGHLNQHGTQMARAWSPVLTAIHKSQPAADLLSSVENALKVYPGSPWLYLIRGRCLTALGEFELAVQSYRIATKANPQWFQARLEMARLRLRQGDPQSAFGEAAAAIQTSPQSPLGYELAIISALRSIETSESLSAKARSALVKTLKVLSQSATDSFGQRVLPAVIARVSSRGPDANQIVQSVLQSGRLSQEKLEILSLLTTDSVIRQEVAERLAADQGGRVESLMLQARAIADSRSLKEARRFLASAGRSSAHLPDISQKMIFVQLLSERQPEVAIAEWKSIAESYRRNSRVLKSALRSPVVKPHFEFRQRLVQWLRDATSESSVNWQWEEIRLNLDQDSSEKTSSAAALRLAALLKTAPESRDGYELMAIAMERLRRPDKVIETLLAAIDSGVQPPVFHMRLAELLLESQQAESAKFHAAHAGMAESSIIRQRAAGVLLELREYEIALEVLHRDVPLQITDSDLHFSIVSVVAFASTHLGKRDPNLEAMKTLAASSDRWFQLWLDVAAVESLDNREREDRLVQAGSMMSDTAFRIRRLGGAWRSLARQSQQTRHWRKTLSILTQLPAHKVTPGDQLVLSGVYEQLGDLESAEGIYRALTKSQVEPKIRAIALNNLGVIEGRRGEAGEAEKRIRAALRISPRPEFVDSMVSIHVQRNERNQAIQLLEGYRATWPDSEMLASRLAELRASKKSAGGSAN